MGQTRRIDDACKLQQTQVTLSGGIIQILKNLGKFCVEKWEANYVSIQTIFVREQYLSGFKKVVLPFQ